MALVKHSTFEGLSSTATIITIVSLIPPNTKASSSDDCRNLLNELVCLFLSIQIKWKFRCIWVKDCSDWCRKFYSKLSTVNIDIHPVSDDIKSEWANKYLKQNNKSTHCITIFFSLYLIKSKRNLMLVRIYVFMSCK